MISDKKIRSRLAQQNFQMMSLKKVQSLLKLLKSCIGHVKKISQGESIRDVERLIYFLAAKEQLIKLQCVVGE